MNWYDKKSLTELYELRSKAIDDGEIELASHIQSVIHAKNVALELFHLAFCPHDLKPRKRSGKRTSQRK